MDVNTFYMYLFLNWFTMLVSAAVSDDQKYVCGCRLYACINTRALIPEKLHHCQRSKVIYMACHFNHCMLITRSICIHWKFSFFILNFWLRATRIIYYLWISGETLIKRSIYLQLYLSAKSLQIILNKLSRIFLWKCWFKCKFRQDKNYDF